MLNYGHNLYYCLIVPEKNSLSTGVCNRKIRQSLCIPELTVKSRSDFHGSREFCRCYISAVHTWIYLLVFFARSRSPKNLQANRGWLWYCNQEQVQYYSFLSDSLIPVLHDHSRYLARDLSPNHRVGLGNCNGTEQARTKQRTIKVTETLDSNIKCWRIKRSGEERNWKKTTGKSTKTFECLRAHWTHNLLINVSKERMKRWKVQWLDFRSLFSNDAYWTIYTISKSQ